MLQASKIRLFEEMNLNQFEVNFALIQISDNVYTVRKCAVGDSVPTLTKSKKRGFELKLIESIF